MKVIFLSITSAMIFLLITLTMDAGARHKAKQARLLHHQQSTHHKQKQKYAHQVNTGRKSGRSAYAQASVLGGWLFNPSPLANQVLHSTAAAHDVYVRGQYIGSDPDSRVRDEIRRDWGGW